MVKVWIKLINGSIIHLPIIGSKDFNDSSNPIDDPGLAARGFTENQDFGEFVIEWAPNGRTGKCNQCGICCTHRVIDCPNPDGQCGYVLDKVISPTDFVHKCQHLKIDRSVGMLGTPGAASCDIWGDLSGSFKGCAIWPDKPADIDNRLKFFCGFKFEV